MPDTLQTIQTMGQVLENLTNDAAALEEQLKAKQALIREIEEVKLPDLMDSVGIEEISLSNGRKIILKPFVFARIANEDIAFNWLARTNNTGIIKNQITVRIDRGREDEADTLTDYLAEHGFNPEQKKTIHPATLKSFCAEVLSNPELAQSFPKDAFGIHQGHKVHFK